MTELKDLPKDEQGNYLRKFTANGIEYTIRNISDVMSSKRFIEFQRLTIVFGFGCDFESAINHLTDTQKMMLDITKENSLTKIEPLMKIQALINSIRELSETKYDAAMYLCSIFMTEQNEDIRYWDFDQQTKKIENWIEEGYSREPFLSIAGVFVPMYLKTSQDIQRKAEILNTSILRD